MKKLMLFICFSLLLITWGEAQVPFQGVVMKYVLPIEELVVQDSIIVHYHESFKGKITVFVNDVLLFNSLVEKTAGSDLRYGGTIKRNGEAVLKIVLNDIFYSLEILEFYHPYLRILYEKNKSHLSISYLNISPIH